MKTEFHTDCVATEGSGHTSTFLASNSAPKTWNVAVVGALGVVGTEMIRTLESRQFPVKELRPLDVAGL